MIDDLNTALVQAHRLDLAREAASLRLARLVTCCRPSFLRQQLGDAVDWLRHGQLGTGIDDVGSAPLTSRGCCA
ncbi:MAG: hypothetical protein JWP11_3612 [Frankiales bacterium]|nr:hypothetical protein [Frankiales bacterium]